MSERIDVEGTGIESDSFWASFSELLDSFSARNTAHLQRRDELQEKLDEWHKSNPGVSVEDDNYLAQLKSIGYLVDEGSDFSINVDRVDDEIARVAGPQLVVPVNNARYAINAANAL